MTMKLVYTETPTTDCLSHQIDDSFLPNDIVSTVSVFDPNRPLSDGGNRAFLQDIRDADIIVNSYVYFGRELLDAMEHCRAISFQSTGYNAVDLEYAAEKGIAVISILDYCTQETAENAIAMMMALQRNTAGFNSAVQVDRQWDITRFPGMRRIEGQTMAIIGLGRIGRHVARIAGAGLGMRVIAYDPFISAEAAGECGVELVELDTALAEGDVVSIHMNLTPENRGMFNKETFLKMKKAPIFINEGRGEMMVEEDLKWALDEGVIRGAGIDMLGSEDPDLSACCLIENPPRSNLIINPHSGFWSETSDYLVRKYSIENAVHYVRGEFDQVSVIRNGVARLWPSEPGTDIN